MAIYNETEVLEPELSEGEKFIEEYFIEERIKYEVQKRIEGLKGDSKTYRDADFYLPRYGVYVEFFGRWNDSKEERERYRKKKDVYFKNRIPCIYLYPENLGILEYVFHYRMKKVLRQHNMNRQLNRYLFHDFNSQNWGLPVFLLMSTILVFLTLYTDSSFHDFLARGWILTTVLGLGIYIFTLIEFFRARKGNKKPG
jgi:hypothetical protein